VKVCPICGTEYGDDAAFCSRDRSPLRPAATGNTHDLVGHLVGERYQVERRLGVGGMGEVYLARHVLMGRLCALKVMSPDLSKDPDAIGRFNREATNASRISHPNVCAIYDFGLTPDGLVYLAMEYVEGRTLSALLEESGPMPVVRATALVAQCAEGLEAAHALGIVHRDLKPDNIMVVPGRDRETAKLVDFGIAKAVEGEPGQRVTKTGFVVGTPEYMSPEQLAGDPVDGRCDEYSLALVYYRLITGRLPFEGTSVQETLVKRLTEPPRPLALARPDAKFPAGLQGVMDQALARQPANRYPSVRAFTRALEEVVLGDGVSTRKLEAVRGSASISVPPTRRTPELKPRRASRTLVGAAAVVIVAGGAWGVLHSRVAKPAANPAVRTDSPATLIAVADTAHRVVSPAPAPAPAPPPPPLVAVPAPAPGPVSAPDTAQKVAAAGEDSLAVPEPGHFDAPTTREFAIRRAWRILNSPIQPAQKRADAAARLAEAALLYKKDRAAALQLYQRANALFPLPRFAKMIRQLEDSTPP
jgi:hypothetical protein